MNEELDEELHSFLWSSHAEIPHRVVHLNLRRLLEKAAYDHGFEPDSPVAWRPFRDEQYVLMSAVRNGVERVYYLVYKEGEDPEPEAVWYVERRSD